MNIRGKNVVLTGASGGIGHAIAKKLSDEGARLILVARNEQRLAALIDELGNASHIAVATDLSDAGGRSRLVDVCRDLDEGIRVLINSAGINDFGLFEKQSQAVIKALIETNLLSPIFVCQDFLPLLQQREKTQIINIGSTFGSIGYPGFSAYCASKFGLHGFTEALRRELADSNVQVSYIAPRATRTALNSASVVALNDALGTTMDDPALVAASVMRAIQSQAKTDKYMGWPEKLFVRINALLPGLVDNNLRKQLPVIRRFAANKS